MSRDHWWRCGVRTTHLTEELLFRRAGLNDQSRSVPESRLGQVGFYREAVYCKPPFVQ